MTHCRDCRWYRSAYTGHYTDASMYYAEPHGWCEFNQHNGIKAPMPHPMRVTPADGVACPCWEEARTEVLNG